MSEGGARNKIRKKKKKKIIQGLPGHSKKFRLNSKCEV